MHDPGGDGRNVRGKRRDIRLGGANERRVISAGSRI
jgi:hypothetical protein